MSHTPGPWKWQGDPGHSSLVGPEDDDDFVLLWAPYEGLSMMGRLETTGWAGTEEANARLIAAAPELLLELRHLVFLIEPLERDGRLKVPGLATLNAARAAIAKATGSKG